MAGFADVGICACRLLVIPKRVKKYMNRNIFMKKKMKRFRKSRDLQSDKKYLFSSSFLGKKHLCSGIENGARRFDVCNRILIESKMKDSMYGYI